MSLFCNNEGYFSYTTYSLFAFSRFRRGWYCIVLHSLYEPVKRVFTIIGNMGDITIGFTDLNPVLDTVLANQYASRGITFSPPLPLIFSPGAGGSTHFLVKSVFAGGSLNGRPFKP